MTAGPDLLTVVIISLCGGEALDRSVAALRGKCRIVVIPQGRGRGPVPHLRMRALRSATTPLVAFLEDTADIPFDWPRAVCDGLRDDQVAAVSGPVRISSTLPPRYRALALTEYGRFHPERWTGQPAPLNGLGFAVRQSTALAVYAAEAPGIIEGELAQLSAAAGFRLAYAPGMELCYDQVHPQAARLATRYLHGRLYAAARVSGQGFPVRASNGLRSMLLPLVLTYRALAKRPRELKGSPATLVWVLAMSCAWALGEFVGYFAGPSEKSLEAWS